jgi:hypothetical protein
MTADDETRWGFETDARVMLRLAAPRIGPRRLGWFFVACAETLLRDRPADVRSTRLLPAVRAEVDAVNQSHMLRQLAREWERDEVEQLLRLIDEARGRKRGTIADRASAAVAASFLSASVPRDDEPPWWEITTDVDPIDRRLLALITAFDHRRDQVATDHLPHLRDIAGNPFRPVAFDPSWRTEAAVALARGMYESRDFAPMPVLADALEDAGCAEPDILAHCRKPGLHVRGCWVVDLVLGKS